MVIYSGHQSKAYTRNLEAAAEELQDVIRTLDDLEGRDEDRARSQWRLGRCYWNMGGEA